jgi:hypothetical protein
VSDDDYRFHRTQFRNHLPHMLYAFTLSAIVQDFLQKKFNLEQLVRSFFSQKETQNLLVDSRNFDEVK